jgi:hypothetical protein
LANAYLEAAQYAYRKSQNTEFYAIAIKWKKDYASPAYEIEDTLVNINGICRKLAKELKEAETPKEETKTETPKEEIIEEKLI